MAAMQRHLFRPRGALAIDPAALGHLWSMMGTPTEPFTLDAEGRAVVDVCGPIMQKRDWCFDSYEEILKRVQAALDSSAEEVVLRLDSPGGVVAGCFQTCRAIRAAADEVDKTLTAEVAELAVSAAYALACACDRIVVPPTGCVGHVGVIEMVVSEARAAYEAGYDLNLIVSGARKADGHPAIPLSDDARAALQHGVDQLASEFFAYVGERRPALAGKVDGFEAAVYYGREAIDVGFADALLAESGDPNVDEEEMMAALKAAAEDDSDPEKQARAKRMLAAAEDPKEDEADAEDENDDEPAAEDYREEPGAEDEENEPEAKVAKAAKSPSATVSAMARRIAKLEADANAKAKAEAAAVQAERDLLWKSRPDAPAALKKAMAKASPDEIKEALAAIPKPDPAAAAKVIGTRGAGQGVNAGAVADVSYLSERSAQMDRKMGLATQKRGTVNVGNRQYFNVPLDDVPAAPTSDKEIG